MKSCRLCRRQFDPQQLPNDPAVQVGQILAEQEYTDAGEVCAECLASRGRLAMMYCCDCFD